MDIKLIKNKNLKRNLLALLICICISVICIGNENLYYRSKEFLDTDFYHSYDLESYLEHISSNSVYTVLGDNASKSMIEKSDEGKKIISENTLMQIFVKNNNNKRVYSNNIFDFKKYMDTVKYYPIVYEINYKQNVMYLLRDNEKIRVSTKHCGNLAQRRKEDITTYIAMPDISITKQMERSNNNDPLYEVYKGYKKEVENVYSIMFIKLIASLVILGYFMISILGREGEDKNILLKNNKKELFIVLLGFIFTIVFSLIVGGTGSLHIVVNTIIIYIAYLYFISKEEINDGVKLSLDIPIIKFLGEVRVKNIKLKNILPVILAILAQPVMFIIYVGIAEDRTIIYPEYIYFTPWIITIGLDAYLIWSLINKISNIEKIRSGVSEIKKGNLDYKINIKEDKIFDEMVEDINEIGEAINIAVEDRVKSERMKNELITNVSHDLKTPLTAMINYISLMKNEDVQPEYIKDYVKVLDKRSQRLKVLIEDLFEASKIGSNNVELSLENNDINQLLTQTLVEMEEYIDESGLEFILNLPENEVYVLADGKKTFRVFENIISNILKYSLTKTRVYIDLVEKEDKVLISFKNISKNKLNFDPNEITERFTRGDLSRNTEGSGLGLAIAKGFVEAQGGTFEVDIIGDLFVVNIEFDLVENI